MPTTPLSNLMPARRTLADIDFANVARPVNIADPVSDGDGVNMRTLKSLIEGIGWKKNARVKAPNVNVVIASPGAVIDGVPLVLGDTVLLDSQINATENGLWTWGGAAVPMVRSPDASTGAELQQAVVTISEGTSANTTWRQASVGVILGETAIDWVPFGVVSPAATQSVAGVVRLATQVEVDGGTSNSVAVPPSELARILSELTPADVGGLVDALNARVSRNSSAAPVIHNGVMYVQLGPTSYSLARNGAILGFPISALSEASETAENMLQFTGDSSMLIGPSDRPDIFIETPSFSDVTLRRQDISFLLASGMPGELTVGATGTGSAGVVANNTYGRMAQLQTGATSGGKASLELTPLRMQVFNSCRLVGFFYVPQSGNQFVTWGYQDATADNYIRFERVDTATESQWFGVVRIAGGAPTYTGLGGAMTGVNRRAMMIYITPTGANFYIGDALNLPVKVGTYTGPIPTAGVAPHLSISSTSAGNRLLYCTHAQVVWPG